MSRCVRWLLLHDDGTEERRCPPVYGTKIYAARHYAWLLDDLSRRGEAWIFARLVRVEPLGPGVVKVPPLNTGTGREIFTRGVTALNRKAGGQ